MINKRVKDPEKRTSSMHLSQRCARWSVTKTLLVKMRLHLQTKSTVSNQQASQCLAHHLNLNQHRTLNQHHSHNLHKQHLSAPRCRCPLSADVLIQSQSFSGSFPPNAQHKAKLLTSPSLETTLGFSAEVFYTLVVVCYLKKYFAQPKYLLLVNKARSEERRVGK